MNKKTQTGKSKSLIGIFFTAVLFIIFTNCGGKQEQQPVNIGNLPSQEQQEVQNYSDTTLGETSLLMETDLNPLLIEQYINETELITARTPKFTLEPKETDALSSIDSEMNEAEEEVTKDVGEIEAIIGKDKLEKFTKAHAHMGNIREHFKKYGKLLESLREIPTARCTKKAFQGSFQTNLTKADGILFIQDCKIGDYNVSGTIGTYIDTTPTNTSQKFILNNLEFKKDKDKYVNFITGTIEISITTYVKGITRTLKVSNTRINDTEDGFNISATRVVEILDITNPSSEDREATLTRELDVSWTKGGEVSSLKGTLSGTRKKSENERIFLISVTGPDNGRFLATSGDGIAKIKIVHKRAKSDDPKRVSIELSNDINYSSPTTSFSISLYRYRSVNKEKVPDGNTFSLIITNQVSTDSTLVKSYSHSVTIVKGRGEFTVSGLVHIIRKDRTKINITLSNVKLVRECPRPAGGTMEAEIDGNKKVKINVEFTAGCVCEHKAKVEKDGKTIIIDKANMCSAGENEKKKMHNDMMRTMSKDDEDHSCVNCNCMN